MPSGVLPSKLSPRERCPGRVDGRQKGYTSWDGQRGCWVGDTGAAQPPKPQAVQPEPLAPLQPQQDGDDGDDAQSVASYADSLLAFDGTRKAQVVRIRGD